MTESRLRGILSRFSDLTILSVGDFFLDRYWTIDPHLAEKSIETGLTAHQIVGIRCAPGGAGTVAKNLCALGVGRTLTLGILGEDGEGSELVKSLQDLSADTSLMIASPHRLTPTYTKPVSIVQEVPKERERFDIKNRTPTPQELQEQVVGRMRDRIDRVDAVVISDQVDEAKCGAVTELVRDELCDLAAQKPDIIFVADSRARVGSFSSVRVKPNRREAMRAVGSDASHPTRNDIERAAQVLHSKTGRPVFITCGAEGIFVHTAQKAEMVPGFGVEGELDSVGAGDNAMAAIAASLAAGADDFEAALVGNLAAAVTVRKIGETGSSTHAEILDLFRAASGEPGGSP